MRTLNDSSPFHPLSLCLSSVSHCDVSPIVTYGRRGGDSGGEQREEKSKSAHV